MKVNRMKVRWLGNAALEVFGEKHILIDPNCEKEPAKKADIILITHEHDDHFSKKDYEQYGETAEVYAPKKTLEKYDLEGEPVQPDEEIHGIKVLESDCWGSDESISYFYNGLLHTGDSASFPAVEGVKVIFSACFPDYYDEYVTESKKLDPNRVIPFHYDPKDRDALQEAKGLKNKLEEASIPSQILEVGEAIKV